VCLHPKKKQILTVCVVVKGGGGGGGGGGAGTVGQCDLCLYKVSSNSTTITDVTPNHKSYMNASSIINACVDVDIGN